MRTVSSRRIEAALLFALVSLIWPRLVVAQVVPLTGENLSGTGTYFANDPVSAQSCSFTGGPPSVNNTFAIRGAGGVATGPYPGTFTEAPCFINYFASGPPALFDCFFAINSPNGVINGRKLGVVSGTCFQTAPGTSSGFFQGTVPYTATICPTGAPCFSDSGNVQVFGNFLGATFGGAGGPGGLSEPLFTSTAVLPPGPPATVMLSPFPTATNPVGTNHTVTATVKDVTGRPVAPGTTVQFTVTGSVNTSGSCSTDTNGQCSFTYAGPQFPGTDAITATAGMARGATSKVWVFPASTPGQKVTGGGQTIDFLTFGFNVQDNGGLVGHCNIIDHVDGHHFKCEDVQALVVTPPHATFFGNGTLDGVSVQYRIDVDDVDMPDGSDAMFQDTFRILTSSGYSKGGIVVHGTIEIH